jgi:DNA repair exonuclease SbcCD ATPase subunit
MRLTLVNFGIWTKRSFEFSDNGLTLIFGHSGKGKTTIFRAINYALTGKGSKLPTIGEKKCSVSFSYKGLDITRCNTPSRLAVSLNGSTYEGDEAQSIIYQQIGKNFEISGYIQQKGENSFLGMSPADKLNFLEKIAFSEVPIDDIKEKVKETANKYELKLSSIQGELKYLHDNPVENPGQFPHNHTSILQQLQSLKGSIKLLTATRDRLEQEKLQQHLLQEKKKGLVRRIMDIQIQSIPDKILPDNEEDELKAWVLYDDYQKEKQIISNFQCYFDRNQNEIDRLVEILNSLTLCTLDEKKDLDADLKELTVSLRDYNFQKEMKNVINSFSQERYDNLVVSISDAEEKLRVILQSKEARVCPSCNVHLRVMKEKLEIFSAATTFSSYKEEDLRTQIKEQRKELTALEIIKRQIEKFPPITEEIELDPVEVEQAIRDLHKIKSDREVTEKKYLDLTKDKTRFINDSNIMKLKERIEIFNKRTEPVKPMRIKSELEKLINLRKIRDLEIERLNNDNIINQRKKDLLKKELDSLPDQKNIGDIEQELTIINEQLEESRSDQIKYTQLEKESQLYQKKVEEYLTYTKNKQHSQEKLIESEKNFTLAKKFKEHVRTAEMLALNGLIEEINSHLSTYLSVFFPDNPLTLALCLFKANEKTKTVRNQINIQIGYRGVNTDLTTLSGGEIDRVNLAFTLALAEIFSIPLLMLDETLSSLDSETTQNILEHIQKESRSILVIAHQVSSGLFDHVHSV